MSTIEPLHDLLEAMEGRPEFSRFVEALVPVVFEPERKREVASELRDWVTATAPRLGVPLEQIDRVRTETISLAFQRALASAPRPPVERRADRAARRGRQLLRATARYLHPVALSYRRAVSANEEAASRYGALLDTYEILVIFLAHAFVSTFLQSGARDSEMYTKLGDLLVRKPNLSTGDWQDLLLSAARQAIRDPLPGPLSDAPAFLVTECGKLTANAKLLTGFCFLRNRHWGHRLGRDTGFYERRLEEDLPLLEAILDEMNFLEDLLLVVPTRVEEGAVTRAHVYQGAEDPYADDDYTLPLRSEHCAGGAAWVQPNHALLLVRDGDFNYVSMYPFACFRDTADRRRRGVHLLLGLRWAARGRGRYRLQRAEFVPVDLSREPEVAEEYREAVERALQPIVECLLDAVGAAPTLAREDVDHGIVELAADCDARLREFVGRKGQCEDLHARVAELSERGGMVVVTGGPGSGKTSFLYASSEGLGRTTRLFHSVSLCRDPQRFLRALIYQCGQSIGRPLGDAAYSGTVEELRLTLERHMQEAVRVRGEPCVCFVDALEELECPARDWDRALQWLPRVVLPGCVFVLSCRPNERLMGVLRWLTPVDRRRDIRLEPLTVEDVQSLAGVQAGARAPLLSQVLGFQELHDRSDGNPLFVRCYLQDALAELDAAELEERPPRPMDAKAMRPDLRAVMERLWQHAIGATHRLDRGAMLARRDLLLLLAIAREPGMSMLLAAELIANRPESTFDLGGVRDLLAELAPYLREVRTGRYGLFHDGLREYAREMELGPRGLRDLHARIARLLLKHGRDLDEVYWRRNLLEHAERGMLSAEERRRILEDEAFVAAALADGGGADLGAWIRQLALGDPERGSPPVLDGPAFAIEFLEDWGPGTLRFSSLPFEGREGLARCLTAASLDATFGRAARDVFHALYDETGEARFLVDRARISYQDLDEWADALTTLREAAAGFAEGGEPLEEARARLLAAQIQFDAGTEDADPEDLLRRSCLPVFERLGRKRDWATAIETLGVVIDAEGRWDEARSAYEEAHGVYEDLQDGESIARVSLNQSIALLFSEGRDECARELARVGARLRVLPRSGTLAQLRAYHAANATMLALFSCDWRAFNRHRPVLEIGERWLSLAGAEADSIRTWFEGNAVGALDRMARLSEQFQAMGDAWGAMDNALNAGFLLLSIGREAEAAERFAFNFERCVEQDYPVGAALAAEGFSRTGVPREAHAKARAFYARHLHRLFEFSPSPFVPTYVLLLP